MTKKEELQLAKDMYMGWIKAEQAVMTGQEYRMGTKILKRADLSMIRDAIKYWKSEVERLEGKTRIKIRQIVPRDI